MKLSARGLAFLMQVEGCRSTPYKDSGGLWTIGYGHLIGDGKTLPESAKYRLTRAQMGLLLKYDVAPRERAVARLCPVTLTQNEFDALVSFTYNLGAGTLQRSTLRQKLNRGDKVGAARALLKYNMVKGKIIPGLVNRRRAEYKLFMSDKNAVI